MAESENKPSTPTTNSLGLRAFNATGRDDTTTEIIRPKQDPRMIQRNTALIALVIVAFLIASVITFQRSGLDINEIFSPDSGSHFGGQQTKQNFETSQ